MKKRITYIDIARAFAIIFIVLGHVIVHSNHTAFIYKFLYSFHIALFFIISGYCFKVKKEESFFQLFKNKFLRTMLPFFIWAVLFLIPYFIFGSGVDSSLNTGSSFDFKSLILNILYGNGNNQALKQNTSLWFLPALFTTQLVYYFIIRFINRYPKTKILVGILIFLIGWITSNLKFIFPWGINTVLNIGIFFYLGYIFKSSNLFDRNSFIYNKKMIFLLGIIGIISCFGNYATVSCFNYDYGYYILSIISGICFSIIVIYISFLINNNRCLEFIGRKTMAILIFHKLIIVVFQTKLGSLSRLLINSNFFVELLFGILITFISIGFSLLIDYFVRLVSPLLLGEKNDKDR